eukprot:TRINITY_DN14830_c0_g1_i2.p2 TRINITY_DN14830_c0_g1~~TRINITY_DN14830_c0_g1_i2.p2  ORF type:complete len:175 (+),score=52.56 TRINITY_DN14830_c0_g1_i2:76-600(+)
MAFREEDVESGTPGRDFPPDDPTRNRFPCCVVWGPLPPITWLLPFIGHMGITDSEGRVHDFQGPFTVTTDRFMTGKVTRILRLPVPPERAGEWDACVDTADREFGTRWHNICCNNCHHHSAMALERWGLPHNQVSLLWLVITKGEWVGSAGVLITWLPFFLCVALIAAVSYLSK